MARGDAGKPHKKLKRVARALYEGDADDAGDALKAFGLKLEKEAGQDTECWPENWQPLKVLEAMSTQWNVVPNSVIGLRYEALPVVLNILGVKKKARADLLEALRIMEQESLLVFNTQHG